MYFPTKHKLHFQIYLEEYLEDFESLRNCIWYFQSMMEGSFKIIRIYMNNILISIWLQAWVDGMKHRSSCCPYRTFLDRNIQLFEILLRYVDNVIFSPEAKIIFFLSFKIHFCIRYSWIWMQIDDVSQSHSVRNRMTCLHRPWVYGILWVGIGIFLLLNFRYFILDI